ncbi:hypothetical protein Y032_0088g2127 [Ancylostoma ceylanicum]|uniref:Secreted protein n=1 Tax=Ancylostoma ceylanicum TaxID=53326 RepID=A0A016TNJ3_9BILA|nr:hypothetical protein Y032_0088g2127 [Ancylostoma ceylanicum]
MLLPLLLLGLVELTHAYWWPYYPKPIRIKTLKQAVAVVMSQIMVVRLLKSIGKARELSRCVPHALMQYGMDRCADVTFCSHAEAHPLVA